MYGTVRRDYYETTRCATLDVLDAHSNIIYQDIVKSESTRARVYKKNLGFKHVLRNGYDSAVVIYLFRINDVL